MKIVHVNSVLTIKKDYFLHTVPFFISDQYINNMYDEKHRMNEEILFKILFEKIVSLTMSINNAKHLDQIEKEKKTLKVQKNTNKLISALKVTG